MLRIVLLVINVGRSSSPELSSLAPACPQLCSFPRNCSVRLSYSFSLLHRWLACGFVKRKWFWLVASVFLVLGASIFHAGAIAIGAGYAIAITCVHFSGGHLRFRIKVSLPLVFLIVLSTFVLLQFADLFLSKLITIDSGTELVETAKTVGKVERHTFRHSRDSPATFLLYSPCVPFTSLPPHAVDWRGLSDAAFLFDSTVYILAIVAAIPRAFRRDDRGRMLIILWSRLPS